MTLSHTLRTLTQHGSTAQIEAKAAAYATSSKIEPPRSRRRQMCAWHHGLFGLALSALLAGEVNAASTFTVHNNSYQPIVVVMDTNRESYVIQPGGSAVFVKANPLDRPVFRVYLPHARDEVVAARRVGYGPAIVAAGTYHFDGRKLKSGDGA